ncbi:MAG: ABC transporter permease subunit [Chloroflexaceae bacterium]|nr:ABC transporter permease subunit [Chloroflexaceae bacterium]
MKLQLKLERPRMNPIIVKEWRASMRGMRPYAILTFFLVTLVGVAGLMLVLVQQQAQYGATILSAHVGQAMFSGLALWELFLVVFLAPAMTSGTISSERERLTYDMLMVTPIRPMRILWGKLIAALSYLLLLIFAAIPMLSIVLMFGGVTLYDTLKVLLLLLVTTITMGSIGLFCSALFRRTATATVMSYVLVLSLIGGTLLLTMLNQQFVTGPEQHTRSELVYLNPFSALASLLAVPSNAMVGPVFFSFTGSSFGLLPILDLFSPGVIHYGMSGMEVIPIFRATLISYAFLTLLLCWISSHLILPRRRWQPRWSDLSFALLLLALGVLAVLLAPWWYVLPSDGLGGPFLPIAPGMPLPIP